MYGRRVGKCEISRLKNPTGPLFEQDLEAFAKICDEPDNR